MGVGTSRKMKSQSNISKPNNKLLVLIQTAQSQLCQHGYLQVSLVKNSNKHCHKKPMERISWVCIWDSWKIYLKRTVYQTQPAFLEEDNSSPPLSLTSEVNVVIEVVAEALWSSPALFVSFVEIDLFTSSLCLLGLLETEELFDASTRNSNCNKKN